MLNHRMLMTLQHYDRHCSIHRWSLSCRSVLLTDCPDHTMLDVMPVVAGDQYKCHRGHRRNHVFRVNQFHGQHDPKCIHVPWPFLAAGISVNDSILRIFMHPVQGVLGFLFQIEIHMNLHNRSRIQSQLLFTHAHTHFFFFFFFFQYTCTHARS